jgi:hypothetical protein
MEKSPDSDIPEAHRGNHLMILMEIADPEFGTAVFTNVGTIGKMLEGENAEKALLVNGISSAKTILTIRGISKAAAALLDRNSIPVQKMFGPTRHGFMQLLVSDKQ